MITMGAQHYTESKAAALEFVARHRNRPGHSKYQYVIRPTKANARYKYAIYIYTP